MACEIFFPCKTAVFPWFKKCLCFNGLIFKTVQFKINYNFRLFSFYSFYI